MAHRGNFLKESDKNSLKALGLALNEGFGIETDLRDLNGRIVISHDPPHEISRPISFDKLLEKIASSSKSGRIGLNIKSDGLSAMIESKIKSIGINANRFFVFDMSIPDTLNYLKRTIPVYSRISDYEPIPPFQSKATGVWIDNFNGSFEQVEIARNLISQGVRVSIVSPELHGRNHKSLWDKILDSKVYLSPLFELCTDFPVEAKKLFCTD